MSAALEVKGLNVSFTLANGDTFRALRDVDFAVERGAIAGVVGESGSGKTLLMRSIMGILPRTAQWSWAHSEVDGMDLSTRTRGRRPAAAMVFQDPMTSMNPVRRIGFHLVEVIGRWQKVRGTRARTLAVEALERVGIPEPERRFNQYPHELSGGMRQRVMIAMALLARPAVLIADEPTTALDVTVQAQILDLLTDLRREENLSVALVTHDLGVVAGFCDHVSVMCQGRVVEEAPVEALFNRAHHPYTRALLASMPGSTAEAPRVEAGWLADDAVRVEHGPNHWSLVPAEANHV
ncbi:MAG: ABC transporter ATP-binding protein [Propionibacteriaceae bacterium]|nr:ABC transporter ATP-binding protein [Propionibacteriaceae bacterium]